MLSGRPKPPTIALAMREFRKCRLRSLDGEILLAGGSSGLRWPPVPGNGASVSNQKSVGTSPPPSPCRTTDLRPCHLARAYDDECSCGRPIDFGRARHLR